MRVLMTTTPVPSHLAPMLPLARALRAAGHEVRLVGQPDVAELADAASLDMAVVGGPFHADDDLREELPRGVRPLRAFGRPSAARAAAGVKPFAGHARYMVPRYLEHARRFRADLVLASPLEYASAVVAGALDVPLVVHRGGVDPYSAELRGPAAFFLTGLCRRNGLPGLPRPDLVLDPCPPQLQDARAESSRPIRSEDELPPAAPGRPALVLSDRTRELGGAKLTRTVAEAADLAAAAGFSGGVVVHDGAAGPVRAALARGLPQLVLPQVMEEFAAGDALAAAGVALCLDSADAQDDPGTLAAALGRLAARDGFRSAARRLADAVAAMPAPADVVADLEHLHLNRPQRRNPA